MLDFIDSRISAVINEHTDLFCRWRKEYKQRYYEGISREFIPKETSGPAGFEGNLNVLIFNAFADKDPHAQWSYSSYIDKPHAKVDIHFVHSSKEVWLEIGMYASGEKTKYEKDFDKLLNIIDATPNAIGIMLHFEVYKRNRVEQVFAELESKYNDDYKINVKPFELGDCVLARRLSIQRLR